MLPLTILVDSRDVVRLRHVVYKPGYEEALEDIIAEYLPAALPRL